MAQLVAEGNHLLRDVVIDLNGDEQSHATRMRRTMSSAACAA
jgi:hypothetical protein